MRIIVAARIAGILPLNKLTTPPQALNLTITKQAGRGKAAGRRKHLEFIAGADQLSERKLAAEANSTSVSGDTLVSLCRIVADNCWLGLAGRLFPNRAKTMYKKMGAIDSKTFLKIVSHNSNTDISGAIIMVGAGGNPGGETE